MRVANIIEEGKLGGPQIRIARVAYALQDRVHTTVIMPEENSKSFRELCGTLDVSYRTLTMSRITKEWRMALRYLLFSPLEIAQLVNSFRIGGYDLIHVSGGSWQYKGVIAGKLAGKKVVWHLNDTSRPWVIKQLFGVLSQYADGYIFASERSKEYYDLFVKKNKPEFVIPAPVDTVQFDPTQKYDGEEDLIEQWNGKTVIGTVANINPVKGLDVFIYAAAMLNKQIDNLHFVVIGSSYESQSGYFDRLKTSCIRLPVHNFKFVGGREDVRPLLKRFDVYVCSSLAESSPIAVWEAMSMAKPIVSADVGDVARYVRNRQSGLIIPPNDIAALANAIGELVVNRKKAADYGTQAREIVRKKLDLTTVASKHFECYRTILGNQQQAKS